MCVTWTSTAAAYVKWWPHKKDCRDHTQLGILYILQDKKQELY